MLTTHIRLNTPHDKMSNRGLLLRHIHDTNQNRVKYHINLSHIKPYLTHTFPHHLVPQPTHLVTPTPSVSVRPISASPSLLTFPHIHLSPILHHLPDLFFSFPHHTPHKTIPQMSENSGDWETSSPPTPTWKSRYFVQCCTPTRAAMRC
jgi:hypothetical protein